MALRRNNWEKHTCGFWAHFNIGYLLTYLLTYVYIHISS